MPGALLDHLRAIASLFDIICANMAALNDPDTDNAERRAALEAADALAKRTSEKLQLRIDRIGREGNLH